MICFVFDNGKEGDADGKTDLFGNGRTMGDLGRSGSVFDRYVRYYYSMHLFNLSGIDSSIDDYRRNYCFGPEIRRLDLYVVQTRVYEAIQLFQRMMMQTSRYEYES